MGGRRGGQALAGGRLPGIGRRRRLRGDGLSVLREEAGGLGSRGMRMRMRMRRGGGGGQGGVLKRLIDRNAPSSRRVLADLGVGWGSHRRTRRPTG